MRHLIDPLISLLIPTVILTHLFLAPYTKVEESFNIQAAHDILINGLPWGVKWEHTGSWLRERYDHLTFTGSVPRTFVGPLSLAVVSWPFLRFGAGYYEEIRGQLIVRAVLGLYNAYCMIVFRNGVARAFGRSTANWFTLFQASQFHMMYYASRTLPNFFALGLTTLAMRNLLPHAGRSPAARSSRRRQKFALTLLTIAGIVFRSEIAVLLASQTLYLYFRPYIRLPILSIFRAGLLGAFIGLALTVPIDSFFWQRWPLWPELTGFIYNIVEKQSSNWGTSAWHFYFTSALPRLLFNPFVYQICLPFTLSVPILRRQALDILLPNLLFVAIYSFQPHKEWRFIIYTIPPFLAVASAGASWIWTRRAKSFVYRALSLTLIASTLASFIASFGMLAVSRLNYPGAEALNRLHELAGNDTGVVKVHMDALACMTGVTRFMERAPPVLGDAHGAFWVYDKTEDEERLLDPLFWERFDYALAERPERVIGSWQVLATVGGYAGMAVVRPEEGWEQAVDDVRAVRHSWTQGLESGEGMRVRVRRLVGELSVVRARSLIRVLLTKGWWVGMKMEPRIRILKREAMLEGTSAGTSVELEPEPEPEYWTLGNS